MPPVTRYEKIGSGFDRARQDLVVGFVIHDYVWQLSGLNDGCRIAQHCNRAVRNRLLPTELPHQYSTNLIQNQRGEDQCIPPSAGQIENETLVSRKVQAGDNDVGVQNDPHEREAAVSARNSSTRSPTSSGPMPFSLVRRSPYWSNCLHSHSSMYRSSAVRRSALLVRPSCFKISSTLSANSGGSENVMVLLVLAILPLAVCYRVLLKSPIRLGRLSKFSDSSLRHRLVQLPGPVDLGGTNQR